MIEVERSAFRFFAKLCAFDLDEPRHHGKVLWRVGLKPSYFSQDCNLHVGPRGAEPARKMTRTVTRGLGGLQGTSPNLFD